MLHARDVAELHDVRINDLRHTFASRALALGESLTMIGKLLGHTQVQTTARYAHLARDSMQTAASRITESIGDNLLGWAIIARDLGRKYSFFSRSGLPALAECLTAIVLDSSERQSHVPLIKASPSGSNRRAGKPGPTYFRGGLRHRNRFT